MILIIETLYHFVQNALKKGKAENCVKIKNKVLIYKALFVLFNMDLIM